MSARLAAPGAGVIDEPDEPDADYRFGLQAILDGLDALVRSRR